MAMTLTRKLSRRTRGMAMVEMVFVLPLLILLVFAIAEFGLMFSRWLTLSNAVREGARVGVVFRGTCTAATVEQEIRDQVQTYARAGGIPLNGSDTNAVQVNGVCGGAGTQLTVDATYPFPINIPFAQVPTIPLSYSSTMRNEG